MRKIIIKLFASSWFIFLTYLTQRYDTRESLQFVSTHRKEIKNVTGARVGQRTEIKTRDRPPREPGVLPTTQ